MARAAVSGRLIWRVATVKELKNETLTARTLTLDVPGWPGHVPGQHVAVKLTAADGHHLNAYKAGPANAAHGLVVIQEIFGCNIHIRNMVDRFAAAGYLAIAPALFDRAGPGIELGYTADDVVVGRDARMKLTDAMVRHDV